MCSPRAGRLPGAWRGVLIALGACTTSPGGTPAPACREGETRCASGSEFERCSGGTWHAQGACDGACEQGRCRDNACPDAPAQRCSEDGRFALCLPDVGGYTHPRDCPGGHLCEGVACRPVVCPPDTRFCRGQEVLLCNHLGTDADHVEECGETDVCANGVCQNPCGLAAARQGSDGCEFFAIDADNDEWNDPTQFDIVVAGAEQGLTATVYVETRGEDGWVPMAVVTLAPGEARELPVTCSIPVCEPGNLLLDRHPEDTVLARRLAFRVRSDVPVVAYQFSSTDYEGWSSSSGATALMPRGTLGEDHYALTLPGNPQRNRGWVAAVAAEDGTRVELTASAATVASEDGAVPALAPGETFAATIDAGDVLQLASAEVGDDVSGTRVRADRPIAVFAGHECANATGGYCGGGFAENLGGDHVVEAMWPVTAWGRSFVGAHLRHVEQYALRTTTWRVVASEDATEVAFSGDATLAGLPSEPITLGAGEVATAVVTGHSGNPGHFSIEASEPVQVAQFMHGQTASVVVVPTEQFVDRYVFQAPPFFADALVVARPVGVPVDLDGGGFTAEWWSAGPDHEAGWLSALRDGAHVIDSPGGPKAGNFGIQVIGMDVNCSYGYLGGFRAKSINLPPE